MTKFTIYINEAKFTADEATIDLVEDALRAAGFVYDATTEGYISRDFYHDMGSPDAALPVSQIR